MTGPLARLAARALGATAPMTGNPAAAIRPRLLVRFEPDAVPAPPPDDVSGPAGPSLQIPAPEPLPRAYNTRATEPVATARPAPAVGPHATPAPRWRPPDPPNVSPADLEAVPRPLSLASTAVAATGPPVAAALGPPPVRPDTAWVTQVATGAPPPTPPASSRAATPTPPAPLQPLREHPPFRPTPVTSLPDLQQGTPPRVKPEPPPDIVIHIGRIDVAAPVAPPAPSPRPAPPTPPTAADLGDYLRGRALRP